MGLPKTFDYILHDLPVTQRQASGLFRYYSSHSFVPEVKKTVCKNKLYRGLFRLDSTKHKKEIKANF